MKNIVLSLALISLVGGATIAATRAYFTDTATTPANTFTAGTLNVDAALGGAYNSPTFSISNMAPGEVTGEKTITVRNAGSINEAVFGKFTLANDTGLASALKLYEYKVEYFNADGTAAPRWTTHDNYFGETINQDWWIKDGVTHTNFIAAGGSNALSAWITGNGTLDIPGYPWDEEALKPNEYYVIHFKFQMDPAADNTFQGKSVDIGYQVKSTQINKQALLDLGVDGVTAGTVNDHYTYLLGQVTP